MRRMSCITEVCPTLRCSDGLGDTEIEGDVVCDVEEDSGDADSRASAAFASVKATLAALLSATERARRGVKLVDGVEFEVDTFPPTIGI